MAFNFGGATGGVSGGSAWNNNQIFNRPVNFGRGGITQGNINTGNINNRQDSQAEGGTSK